MKLPAPPSLVIKDRVEVEINGELYLFYSSTDEIGIITKTPKIECYNVLLGHHFCCLILFRCLGSVSTSVIAPGLFGGTEKTSCVLTSSTSERMWTKVSIPNIHKVWEWLMWAGRFCMFVFLWKFTHFLSP